MLVGSLGRQALANRQGIHHHLAATTETLNSQPAPVRPR